jgi:hypothetical protein
MEENVMLSMAPSTVLILKYKTKQSLFRDCVEWKAYDRSTARYAVNKTDRPLNYNLFFGTIPSSKSLLGKDNLSHFDVVVD